MRRVFENQTFERFFDRDSGALFCDLEFRRCVFGWCGLSITMNPRLRSTVRNVGVYQCESRDPGGLSAAIIEDVVVDGLKTVWPLKTFGAVFKHVVLRGKIGGIILNNDLARTENATPDRLRAFELANAAYYASVDWALDISEGAFVSCDINGIPARLIRRDPETQVVITREKALEGRWRELDLSDTYWPTAIEMMLHCGDADCVLVAPKRARDFRELLRGIQLLRRAGVAEPD